MSFRSEIEKTVRFRQLWLIGTLGALLLAVAIFVGNDVAFTQPIKTLFALTSIVSFAVAISIGYYLRDAWKHLPARLPLVHLVWLILESAIGIPFAVGVLLLGLVGVKDIVMGN